MKRILVSLVLALGILGAGTPAHAHDAYDDSQSHPLRLVAYAVHPLGFAIEWLVTRPIHFVVSHPQLERVFGHTPHENPWGGYQAYTPEED